MVIVNYGMGTNSTALLVEAVRRGLKVDLIVAADTGDEFPNTYKYTEAFSVWLTKRGFPAIVMTRWLRRDGRFISISEQCLERHELPSKAYGYSGCSVKWKQQPIDKLLRNHPDVCRAWSKGEPVERWIGFDYDEPERAERMLLKNPQPPQIRGNESWIWRCPLVEWQMGRAECVTSIRNAGIALPGKSACYHCPSTKKKELDRLRLENPEYLEKALVIEDDARRNGNLVTVKGLGRSFSWRDYVEGLDKDSCDVVDQECACFDGSDE